MMTEHLLLVPSVAGSPVRGTIIQMVMHAHACQGLLCHTTLHVNRVSRVLTRYHRTDFAPETLLWLLWRCFAADDWPRSRLCM